MPRRQPPPPSAANNGASSKPNKTPLSQALEPTTIDELLDAIMLKKTSSMPKTWQQVVHYGYYEWPAELVDDIIDDYVSNPDRVQALIMDKRRSECFIQLLHYALQEWLFALRNNNDPDDKEDWQDVQTDLIEAMQKPDCAAIMVQWLLSTMLEVGLNPDDALIKAAQQCADTRSAIEHPEVAQATPAPESFDQAIAPLRHMLRDITSDYQLYEQFGDMLLTMPPEPVQGIIDLFWESDNSAVHHGVVLLLLHPQALMREKILTLFTRADILDHLTGTDLRRLIMLRNWLAKQDRSAVDSLIKQARKKGKTVTPLSEHDHDLVLHSIHASSIDDVGAQGLLCVFTQGKRRVLQGVVLKQGVGLIDAWIAPPMSKKEASSMVAAMEEEVYQLTVDIDYLATQIPYGLGLNQRADQPLTAELLVLLESLQLSQCEPQTRDLTEHLKWLTDTIGVWNTKTDIKDSLTRTKTWLSAQWGQHWRHNLTVVESMTFIPKINGNHALKRSLGNQQVDALLEPYRSVWAERFANVAWWAYCNKNTDTEPQAKDALLLAQQLHDDVALHQIPLMKLIAEKSIDIPV